MFVLRIERVGLKARHAVFFSFGEPGSLVAKPVLNAVLRVPDQRLQSY